mmetsp:Transcript_26383/g.47370  ORF Transcript_26383/g.47370 Transcript_26383/m.47370 type:complete len:549 (+) Transcript_26383:1875-3521(+)
MNKYEVQGVVGEGSYGVVLKAKHRETGEIVAIKKFKEQDDETLQKTFMREVKLLRQLKHDNIVQLLEAFRRKTKLYLVFEFVDRTLLEVIEESPYGISQAQVKSYIFQLLKAINHCHKLHIIHRDIKPENLLISFEQKLKLCDFGLARVAARSGEMTEYVATRWYRAPELLLGEEYSSAVDMWSIGCIMGELTDGKPMFPGKSEIDQLYVIQSILGALPRSQSEMMARNPKFNGLRFGEINPETLDKRYLGKMKKSALSLMKSLLEFNPYLRISAEDALRHPYFDDLKGVEAERPVKQVLQRSESCSNRQKLPLFAGPVYVRTKFRERSIPTSGREKNLLMKGIVHSTSPNRQSFESVPKNFSKDFERSKTRGSVQVSEPFEFDVPATSKATDRITKNRSNDYLWGKLRDFPDPLMETKSHRFKLKRKIKDNLLRKQIYIEEPKKPSPLLKAALVGKRRGVDPESGWEISEMPKKPSLPPPSNRVFAGRLLKLSEEHAVLADSTNSTRQFPQIFHPSNSDLLSRKHDTRRRYFEEAPEEGRRLIRFQR